MPTIKNAADALKIANEFKNRKIDVSRLLVSALRKIEVKAASGATATGYLFDGDRLSVSDEEYAALLRELHTLGFNTARSRSEPIKNATISWGTP